MSYKHETKHVCMCAAAHPHISTTSLRVVVLIFLTDSGRPSPFPTFTTFPSATVSVARRVIFESAQYKVSKDCKHDFQFFS